MASNLDRIAELRAFRSGPIDRLRQQAKEQAQEDYERLQRAIARREAAQQSFFKERQQENLLRQKGDIELTLAEQQQAAQMRRDKAQAGYEMAHTSQRANIAADASAQNYDFTMKRDRQQQFSQRERDSLQHGYTMQRDRQQNQQQMLRDETQFGYQTQRDATQQGYTQQNAIQRETFNVSAKWQDQIQQARNAGMEFSEKQRNEMKQMDETFRKNVLNGPMDEGLKQQAMLEHQRKLSAIIPNEKVQNPQEGLNQSLIFHEPTKSWFMQGRDSHGYPTWQPLGSGGSGKQEDPEKKAAEQRSMMLKREETLNKLEKEIRAEVDPETDDLKFKDQDAIDKEKLRRLAPYERFYTDSGLPPHEMYQIQAQREKLKQIEQQARNEKAAGMADSLRLRSGDTAQQAYEADPPPPMPGQMPPAAAPPDPVPVSATNIDDQVKKSVDGGDREAAIALQVVKSLTSKYAGKIPDNPEDRAALVEAMRILRTKGVSIKTRKQSTAPQPFQYGYPGP